MRTTDERMTELMRRVKKAEREKARRHGAFVALGSVAACLTLIVGLSFAMPEMVETISGGAYNYSGPAASAFTGSAAVGFIVIGVLAFALGVCVTVLCYRLHLRSRNDKEDGND